MNEATLAAQRRHDPWQTCNATIERVCNEAPGVNTYDLRLPDHEAAARFAFAPGQFNMIYVPGVGEAAISVSGQTSEGWLQHTVRTVGSVTGAMERGGPGYRLGIRGPFGTPWPVDQLTSGSPPNDVILVAGGIGIAPLRSVIEHLIQHRNQVGSVDVLFGARTPQDLIYTSEHAAWADHHIRLHTTVDRGDANWRGHVGVVTLLLERLAIPHPARTMLLTCGPEVMMRFVVRTAAARGVPLSNAWVTLERNMNCAIGLCGHCQLGTEFICKDGPVFRYDRVSPWLHVQGI